MKLINYYDHVKQRRKTQTPFSLDEAGQFSFLRGKSLRIFFFYAYWEKYSFWFRIFGYGIAGKLIKNHFMLFSERNGYRKSYKFFGWKFEFLH
jgi:hypothetical protein